MTDYTKLIKELRETAKHLDGISRFPYDDDPAKRIYSKKMVDAADAIEALQAEVDTLKRVDYKRCQECLYLGQPVGEQLVEVVRCRECKHRDPETKGCDCAGHEMLMGGILPMPDNWFCADGEREVQDDK